MRKSGHKWCGVKVELLKKSVSGKKMHPVLCFSLNAGKNICRPFDDISVALKGLDAFITCLLVQAKFLMSLTVLLWLLNTLVCGCMELQLNKEQVQAAEDG